VRDTGLEPSKSGVVGLLCAALGLPRSAPLTELAGLRMGVRVDHEGRLERDFHTAGKGGYLKASGSIERKNLIVSSRYYLADAAFLVGLASDDLALLQRLHGSLRHPHWPLFLGRKAFVPDPPVWLPDGLQSDTSLEAALTTYPWLTSDPPDDGRARLVLDDENGAEVRPDHPLSFTERRFLPRQIAVRFADVSPREEEPCTSPD